MSWLGSDGLSGSSYRNEDGAANALRRNLSQASSALAEQIAHCERQVAEATRILEGLGWTYYEDQGGWIPPPRTRKGAKPK